VNTLLVKPAGYLIVRRPAPHAMTSDLFIPGPCPLPQRVRRAVGGQMINPRGPDFAALLADCSAGLSGWLQTDHELLFMASSGTGGLEAAVANLLSPGDQAVFCTMGHFGELWTRIATAYGVKVIQVAAPWGADNDPDALADALDRHPRVRAVFVTHNETSTGVRNDLGALAAVVKARGLLLAIDSVSGAPGHPLDIDALGADLVVLASQKGWLAPPGLGVVAVGEAAMRASGASRSPRYYFDFRLQRLQQQRGATHTTPPLPAMYGLREGLEMLKDEGREATWRRQRAVASVIRAGVEALDLTTVAYDGLPSHTVTAVHSPFPTPRELAAFLTRLERDHGVTLAQGLGPQHGRAFRIGHLGMIDEAAAADLLERLVAAFPPALRLAA
jgi:aspartate aminotransferase-like enzyme